MATSSVCAAAQLTSTDDVEANLAICRDLAAQAADRGASLFVLPECFAFIGRSLTERIAIAERLEEKSPGPILEAVLSMAQDHKMWVLGGGLPERVEGEEDRRTYNTAVLVSPDANIEASYRKIHLFDIDIPGKAQLKESEATAPGHEPVVGETPLGRLGLTICYDVRFPELYRKLAYELGADILTVPAAFTAHTGQAHWHTLLRARAVENQCYVVAAAQTGQHNEKRRSYGHALIYDPWGDLVDEVKEGVGLAVGTLDRNKLEDVRGKMPCRQHRVL